MVVLCMVNEKNSDKIKVKYNLNDFRKNFNRLFPKFYLRGYPHPIHIHS